MLRFLAAVVFGLGAVVPAPASADSIETFIDHEMPASRVPGLAYAVVADGEPTSGGARGVLRAGGNQEVTTDTPFLSGSISKSFTALAVMQLVEAGQVDLDAGLAQYLSDFSGQPAGVVTIRQLLSHTSGFSTLQGNTSIGDNSGGADELARRVEALAGVTPAYLPGQRWEYSNTNYEVLGRVIEVVSGQEYQAYIAEHILEPVGMHDSFVADGEVHPAMATGHTPWFWTTRALPENTTRRGTAPQGGVVASAADLGRYLQMMMNGRDDVLSAEGKSQMMRPAGGAATFYGFGWFVDTRDGTVWHSGSTPGVETLVTMVPSEQRGAVVLVNGGSGVGFGETTALRDGITALALGLDYEGEGSRWPQKALFLSLALLPVLYLVSILWAWRHSAAIRAKTRAGLPGLFSLWFPLFTTLVAAWVILLFVPNQMGAPISTIRLFQPDFGLVLIACAVTGVLWAVSRLVVAYTGRSRPA